jgi:exodeoxyribonuclease-3
MKIVVWNCNMAFRKKAEYLLQYQPDIVIVPECECPDKLKFPETTRLPTSVVWHGDNQNKGLGVFSYGDYHLRKLRIHQPDFKTIIPIKLTKGADDFILFAVWANNPADTPNQYIGQLWKAVHHYDRLIKRRRTILAGDFNSNTIWDKPRRVGNHSDLVDVLRKKKIRSVYHHYFGHEHGAESHPTFNLYKKFEKPYHLDYCFVSSDLILKLTSVEIGEHAAWKSHSDHLPLVVDFDI